MMKILFAAMMAVSPLAALAAGPELVSNGSFEAELLANGRWDTYASLTGWTSGSERIELRRNVAGSAQDQFNFVELDAARNSFMSQDLLGATAVTGQVELSFWYSARANTSASTNGLQVSFGGQTITLTGQDNGTGDNAWIHYTGVFNLDGRTGDTLTFKALGQSDGYGSSIDHVSVTAVPEPATAAMLLAGLAMLCVAARRRRLGA
jgi:hypothetical protein